MATFSLIHAALFASAFLALPLAPPRPAFACAVPVPVLSGRVGSPLPPQVWMSQGQRSLFTLLSLHLLFTLPSQSPIFSQLSHTGPVPLVLARGRLARALASKVCSLPGPAGAFGALAALWRSRAVGIT